MGFSRTMLAGAFAGCLSLASAAPSLESSHEEAVTKRGISCDTLISGLGKGDCDYMAEIGMAGQGDNAEEDNGSVWIGDDGSNTFTVTLNADADDDTSVVFVLWTFADNDYQCSFMNVRSPAVSYSLAGANDSVTISLENGVSGGFTAVVNGVTTLSQYGQIDNTWGEFTTGDYATIDVSREVNMSGTTFSITVEDSGCVSDMDTCVFQCKDGNTCGESGTYDLVNCENNSQSGAAYGTYDGVNPEGGCQGFSNGGHVDITISL